MSTVGKLHETLVFTRRVKVLASWFAQLAPKNARILDVGCGDGLVSAALGSRRPDLTLRGIDVLPREHTHIPVEMFDGVRIPFEDDSVDVVLFSDVLHHTDDLTVLLREARRVARRCVLIKDHFREGWAAYSRLRFMDWVGNARFGVALPYNYWAEKQWQKAWREIGLEPEELVTRLGIYPPPANWIFGARLHFMARLTKVAPSSLPE
jgi:SAM-dependent methyltransferase